MPVTPLRRFVPGPAILLRGSAAAAGSAALAYWWVMAGRGDPPQTLFLVWLAALILWGAALFSRWRMRRPDGGTVAVAVGIAFMVISRAVGLSQVPYAIASDEILYPFWGQDLIRQHPWELLSGVLTWNSDTPYLAVALTSWPSLFLPPLLGARAVAVILGAGSLWSTYALARRLFGWSAAAIAATFLACAHWHIIFSRMAYPCMQPLFFAPLALHAAVMGVEERNRFLQLVAGALLGLTLLVYTPARMAWVIFGAWLAHRVAARKMRLRECAAALVVIALGATVFLTPYFRAGGGGAILQRYREVSTGVLGPLHRLSEYGWTSAAGRDFLAAQIASAARVYYTEGAVLSPSDYLPVALLDPVSLSAVVLGLVLLAMRVRDSGCFLVLVWVVATFVLGQVLTDVPNGAHRAGVILPALAICAGVAGSTVHAAARRWSGMPRREPSLLWLIGLVAVILPMNIDSLSRYLARRDHDFIGAMARFIGAEAAEPVYYLVTSAPLANQPIFRFLAPGHTMRDSFSLMDDLGKNIDLTRTAIFVIGNGLSEAAQAIGRCYPGGTLLAETSGARGEPTLAVAVSAATVQAGRGCAVPPTGAGLRARYFSGPSWDGTVVLERIEDWPIRFEQDLDRFRSVEWSGTLRIPAAGRYGFQLLAPNATAEASVGEAVALKGGEFVEAQLAAVDQPIVIRCSPAQAGGFCWLRWRPPGGAVGVIGADFLAPSSPGRDS